MRSLITYSPLLLVCSCGKPSSESATDPVPIEPVVHTGTSQPQESSENHEDAELWFTIEGIEKPELTGEIPDFSGKFAHPGGDGGYHFSASLTQRADSIFGSYCGGTTNRVDCGMESQGGPDCQIRGIVRQGIGYLSFRSCYTGKVGSAKIRKNAEGIHWETVSVPEAEDGINFCAVPGNAILSDLQRIVRHDMPARFNDVDLTTSDFLMRLPDTDSQFVFMEAKVFHAPEGEEFKTILYGGKAVKIIREAGEYVCQRIGDELFMAPIYEVAIEMYGQEMTGFMYHHDLALLHFTDNRENLFMLGMVPGDNMEPEDLAWTIIGDKSAVYEEVNLKALKHTAHGSFPAYDARVESVENAHYGSFTSLLVNWTIYGGNPDNVSQLLIWDGRSLKTVLTQDQESLVREIHVTRERDSLILNYKRLLPLEQKEFDLMDIYLLSADSLVNLTDGKVASARD